MEEKPFISIAWSTPERMATAYGQRWNRSWAIPQNLIEGFFLFWGKNKDKLRAQGYSISKDKDGGWKLNEWQLRKAEFKETFGKENAGIDYKNIPTKSSLPEYVVKNAEGLRGWQVPSVAKLCASVLRYGSAIDGSHMGLGKTFCAIAVARELNMKIGVICPKAVIYSWKKVITKHFGMTYEFVLNYESAKSGKYKEIGVWKPVSKVSTATRFQWNAPKNTLIIFDESHKLKGHNTINAEIAKEAKKQKYKTLCLSATNAVNPIELKTTGFLLEIYKKNFTQFMRDHGCEKGRFGWEFNGDKKILKKLHYDLFIERGVRLRKEDVPNFPECENIAEAYNIDEESEKELKRVYAEMNAELGALNKLVKNTKEWQINAMTIQLRARQRAEFLKLPLIIEMIEEAIENGMSVAVFVNFSETIRALSKRLHTTCIVWGSNKGNERENNIEAFQTDKERVILLNIKAGSAGISLHDINGKYSRLALISPTPSAVDMRQTMGRIHREGAKSKSINKLLYVANTEEQDTCERVRMKLENLDTMNDGDVMIGNIF